MTYPNDHDLIHERHVAIHRLDDPAVPPTQAYEAAKAAMVQCEAVPGLPQEGPYPATLDEVAESITDALWPLAYRTIADSIPAGASVRAWLDAHGIPVYLGVTHVLEAVRLDLYRALAKLEGNRG